MSYNTAFHVVRPAIYARLSYLFAFHVISIAMGCIYTEAKNYPREPAAHVAISELYCQYLLSFLFMFRYCLICSMAVILRMQTAKNGFICVHDFSVEQLPFPSF